MFNYIIKNIRLDMVLYAKELAIVLLPLVLNGRDIPTGVIFGQYFTISQWRILA